MGHRELEGEAKNRQSGGTLHPTLFMQLYSYLFCMVELHIEIPLRKKVNCQEEEEKLKFLGTMPQAFKLEAWILV